MSEDVPILKPPNPSRPRPRRPDPTNTSGKTEDYKLNVALVIVVLVVIGFFVFALFASSGHSEDKREIRQYGPLTCVYNVDQDKVESCGGEAR